MHNLLRLPEVTKRTGLSRSFVYAEIKDGRFPKPVKITKRTSAWIESEIDEWIERRIAERGSDDEQRSADRDERAA